MLVRWEKVKLWWKKRRSNPAAEKPRRRWRPRLELEELERRDAPAIFHVSVATDNGNNANPTPGSLRDGVNQVDAGNFDTIDFAPLGGGNVSVTVQDAALPAITHPVTITGVGQQITVQGVFQGGDKLPSGSAGLTFAAGSNGSQVLGLTITGFQSDGILISNVAFITIGGAATGQSDTITNNGLQSASGGNGVHITGSQAHDNVVLSSIIGTDSMGHGSLGNSSNGVLIDNGAYNNRIGGLNAKEQNVISGNSYSGVAIDNSNGNTIAGNYIGPDPSGKFTVGTAGGPGQPRTQQTTGVTIRGSSSNNYIGAQVATTQTGVIISPANLISGNWADGVDIVGQDGGPSPSGNWVEGNWIGTDVTGIATLANGLNGVWVSYSNQNHIGDAAAGDANVISGNGSDGIGLEKSSYNVIRTALIGTGPDISKLQNWMFNRGDGVFFDASSNYNTVKDSKIRFNLGAAVNNNVPVADNHNKVYDPNSIFGNASGIVNTASDGTPVLTSAVEQNDSLTVQGTLSSTPDTEFLLEFFGNPIMDPAGDEQGAFYLGNLTVTTDDSGNASFQTSFSAIYGVNVSATATDTSPTGDTSQFSNETPILIPVWANAYPGTVPGFSGAVWNDLNHNGQQDSGEPGIANVVVNLFNASGQLVASTTTDANGNYQFTNLTPGQQYYVQFVPPMPSDVTQPYAPSAQIILVMYQNGQPVYSMSLWEGIVDDQPWGD